MDKSPRTRAIVKKELETTVTKMKLDPQNQELMRDYARLAEEFNKCCKGLAEFMRVYRKWLEHYHRERPQEYAWPMSEFNGVVGRMLNAIQRNRFNKDTPAIKATCKELGIPWTYKGIAEFIK